MRSIARGSQYGTSLYEFSVCGVAADAAPGDVIGIDITADALSVDEDKTLALHAMAYRLDGSAVETYVPGPPRKAKSPPTAYSRRKPTVRQQLRPLHPAAYLRRRYSRERGGASKIHDSISFGCLDSIR